MNDTQTHTTGGTEMPLTHCHTCGRALPWNRIYLGDRAYCGAECLPAKTVDILPDPCISALEADLAEALGAIAKHLKRMSGKRDGQVRFYDPELREAAYILARHGKFRVSYDAEFTEGEWTNG